MTTTTDLDVPIYLSVDDKTRPWMYLRAVPRTDKEREQSMHKTDMGGASVQVKTRVYNGRDNKDLSLDKASFELVECPTALSTNDFYNIQKGDDENNLRQKYYDEASAFVKKKVGCDKVVCFHSQVRNAEKVGECGVQGYASGGPHTDSSPISADELAIMTAASAQEEDNNNEGPYERYMYINLWRNISDDPIEDNHLAMLDERTTVKPDDYIARDFFGDGFSVVQYGLNARHHSNHKWYYFPRMEKHEAILFKQMDSDWTKASRICFHMSVSDPNAKKDAKTRESIELRMMCFWNKKEDSGSSSNNSVDSMPTKENMNMDMIRDPEEVAGELSVSSLDSASIFDLTKVLLLKIIFFFVPFLRGVLIGAAGSSGAAKQYSGNPRNYLDKFIGVVDSFPSWPTFAANWIKGHMKQAKGDAEKGIEAITRELVNDAMGYQGTKAFKPQEKKEIADFLLGNEKYMETARKHWGPLA